MANETHEAAGEAPALLSLDEANARLLAPGSPFALTREKVLGVELEVYENRARSLRELLERSRAHGDNEYLVFDDGRRITYAEHLRIVASVAKALHERFDVGKGDRVAILAANCPEWIVTYWACASLGAIAVCMNGWWAGDEIEYGLDLGEPKLLVADERRLARLDGKDPGVTTVVIEREFEALWNYDPDAALPDAPLDEDDPAILLFTSGTTGRPKAALLSHRALCAFVMTSFFIGARRGMTEGARGEPGALLAAFPLFHVSGLFGSTTTSLAGGAKTVWPTGRFDAGSVLELTQKEHIRSWSGASTHILRLLGHEKLADFDGSVLNNVGIGGSATTPELIRRTEERFPHLRGTFASGYGSTETGALVSYASNEMLRESEYCVGPPLPTVEVRVVDDDGRDLPDGEDGHICVRSPLVMLAYWRNEEANAEVFLPERWLDTGDVGHLRGGRLHLAARKRDLILRGGENVYPAEVENRLEGHPGVAEVAVFGVEHPELGQEVKAVVVARAGVTLDAEEIRRFAAEKLAYYKVPAHIEIQSEALPRNATGKVMKHVLAGEGENHFVEE